MHLEWCVILLGDDRAVRHCLAPDAQPQSIPRISGRMCAVGRPTSRFLSSGCSFLPCDPEAAGGSALVP